VTERTAEIALQLTASVARLTPITELIENREIVRFTPPISERLSRSCSPRSDSAKSYENPARRTRVEKCVSFPGVLKRHLSVHLWGSQKSVGFLTNSRVGVECPSVCEESEKSR
jgi:hypothetical protein